MSLKRSSADLDPFMRIGVRFGRHTALYAAASVFTLLGGFGSLAVLTRYMAPPDYGVLAVCLVLSALLTVLFTLGLLQGAFLWVFGSSGDDEGGDDDAADAVSARRADALTTALLVIAAVAAAGTAVIAYFAPWFAEVVLGSRRWADAITLAAVSGALGALWRMVHNVLRMERRPGAYVVLTAARPMLVLAISIPLVVAGEGVVGALSGTAAGTGIAVLAALAVTWRSYALAVDRRQLRQIARSGLPFIPVVMSLWILHNADVYLLSRWVPDAEVGIYRVASRAGALMSYFVSAFLMSWGPLVRTPMFAIIKERDGISAVSGKFATYFAFAAMALLLALTVGANVVVQIAAPSYHDAASLIPLTSLAFAAYGAFILIYRLARFPHKRLYYSGVGLVAAAVLIGSAAILIPWLGAYGAALAAIVSSTVGAVGMLYLSQRGPEPIEYEYGRVAAAALIALLCVGAARAAAELPPGWSTLADIGALLAFPALLVITGVFPRAHLRTLRSMIAAALPRRPQVDRLGSQLQKLPARDRELLLRLTDVREDPARLAREASVPESALLARAVVALRQMTGVGSPGEHDADIGRQLMSRRTVAERDAVARGLWAAGVDPSEVDALETIVQSLRRVSARKRAAMTVSEPEVLSEEEAILPAPDPIPEDSVLPPEVTEASEPLDEDASLSTDPYRAESSRVLDPPAADQSKAPRSGRNRRDGLKVCMLLHKGVEHDSRVQREARTLQRAGHVVTVVNLGRSSGTFGVGDEAFEILSAAPAPWVRRALPFNLYRLVFMASFLRRIRRLEPDVVHAHDAAMLVPGIIGARSAGSLLVYDSHEYATGVPYRERAWTWLVRTVERTAIRRCAAVITVSDGIAARLTRRYRLAQSPTVVRNLPSLPRNARPPGAKTLRSTLGIDGRALILHQGEAAIDRGCETLVRAMGLIRLGDRAEAAHLVFLGGGEPDYLARLKRLAAYNNVDQRVHFVPSVPLAVLLAYTREGDVGVCLLEDTCENHRLALPNKLFEYIAAGVPVVASALPEMEAVVRGYRIGWTVDPSDPRAVADRLVAALRCRDDELLRQRLDVAGEALTWENEESKLVDLYASLADRRSSSDGKPAADSG